MIAAMKSSESESIYQSCIEASKDPSIILNGTDFGNRFNRSLTTENIFSYNSAFSELAIKAGQLSVACFNNKIFELQQNIVRPQL